MSSPKNKIILPKSILSKIETNLVKVSNELEDLYDGINEGTLSAAQIIKKIDRIQILVFSANDPIGQALIEDSYQVNTKLGSLPMVGKTKTAKLPNAKR